MEEIQGIYEGEIELGKKYGLGCYLWNNGNFYNGNWESGKMNGNGTLYYSNGGILKGNFVDGKMEGVGKGTYSNGDIYIGLWKNGMFHGEGLFYMKITNKWQAGRFENGSMMEIRSAGEGKPNSLSYI